MKFKAFKKQIYIPLNGLNVSRRMEFALLSRYLDLRGSERILDVACGDGFWTAKMASRVQTVVGFDYNPLRLQQARRLYPEIGGLIGSDAHCLPFADGVFDAVVGICVLEHFRDDLQALREMRRVSKAGAKLALTVDSFSLPGISAADKERHAQKYNVSHWYQLNSLTKTLKDSGFRVVEHTYLLKPPLSAALYKAAQKSPKLAYLMFPLSYPLSLLSEHLSGQGHAGYKLAVAARAV